MSAKVKSAIEYVNFKSEDSTKTIETSIDLKIKTINEYIDTKAEGLT